MQILLKYVLYVYIIKHIIICCSFIKYQSDPQLVTILDININLAGVIFCSEHAGDLPTARNCQYVAARAPHLCLFLSVRFCSDWSAQSIDRS